MKVERIVSNAAWAASLKIAGVAFTMIVNVLVARLLPVEWVGYYFLTSSLAIFGALVARLGMRQSVVKVVAKNMTLENFASAKGAIKKFLVITLIGSLVTSVALLLLEPWINAKLFNGVEQPFVLFVIVWLTLLALQSILSDGFRGINWIPVSSLIDGALVNAVLALILVALYLLSVEVGFNQVIYLTILSYALVVVFAWLLIANRVRHFTGVDESRYQDIISLSIPIFIVNLCTYLAAEASLWFVAVYSDPRDVAIYGACMKLVKLVTLPLLIQNFVVTPLIVQLHTREEMDRLQKLIRASATVTALPSILLIIVFMFFGGSIMGLIFGDIYAEGWGLLAILSIGYLVNVCSGPCNNTLLMTGHERAVMKLFLVSTTAAIISMILFGKQYGAVGIAYSVSAVMILHNLISIGLAKKYAKISTFVSLNPGYLAYLLQYLRSRRG